MSRFLVIAERLEGGRLLEKDFKENNTVPIFQRVRKELAAGAMYIDLNTEDVSGSTEILTWGVKLIQEHFDNVPLCFESDSLEAVEAALDVYNTENGRAIINYADSGKHAPFLDLAARKNALCVCRCSRGLIPVDNDERISVASELLERAVKLGMNPEEDLLFNPVFLITKGMQEKQEETLEAITTLTEMGLKTTGGISKVADGAPKPIRSVLCAAFSAMAIQCGLSSGILNPLDKKVMETILAADMIKNHLLYSDKIFKNYLSDEENRFKTQ